MEVKAKEWRHHSFNNDCTNQQAFSKHGWHGAGMSANPLLNW